MPAEMSNLSQFVGVFAGEGHWVDIAGDSKRYRIRQSVVREDNRLTVSYTHEFFEEGNTTHGEFVFEHVEGPIFAVHIKGAPVGNGYAFAPYLHFNIKVGEIFVETSYELSADGLLVRGSSTSNAQGRFIAWTESLARG